MKRVLVQYDLEVKQAVTANKTEHVIGKSVLLNNAGTNVVTINGNLTLVAGATFQFNVIQPNEIIEARLKIMFTPSPGGTNRLEIVTASPIDCDYSNYNPV